MDESANLNSGDIELDEFPGGTKSSCQQLFQDSTIPDNNDVQDTIEVDYRHLILQEMESRFAIGETVENEHVAYALYNKYARAKGFSVRRGSNITFKNGDLRGKIFLCNREGLKDTKRSNDRAPDYVKTDTRCNCKAMIKVERTRGGPWKVKEFYKEHNHDMFASDQTYLLRSSRNITDEQEVVLTSMIKSKIPISKAMNFLENVADGRENVGCTRRDAYDCAARIKRKTKIENMDTFELLQHFINRANDEPDFYWNVTVDDDNRLMDFFFRDSRSLIDYGCFSDVVTVDTTYRTNRFDLICALFVGINHHKENVLFGFALISDETEATFTWLFKTFLKCMGNKQHGMIFTDQCQAMMNAVETVFPNSYHKLCQWHINANAPSHFGSLNNDSRFQYLWSKCMSYCESVEEFEVTWKKMIDYYKIDKKNWFNTMYDLRKKWANAFSNEVFSAGLHTTSRSEGANSTLKQNIKDKSSSLLDCVVAYEKVQDDWRLKEKEKDTLCHHNKPTLFVPHNPLLKQVADVYTLNMFKMFEKELKDTMGLEIPEKSMDDDFSVVSYKVKSYGGNWFRTIEYDSEKMEIKCSCHKFETLGILCSHALKVLEVVNMRYIPDKYITKRWSKMAKSDVCDSHGGSKIDSSNPKESSYIYEMAFVSHATKECRELAVQGKKNVEARKILMKHIGSAKKEMEALFKKMKTTRLPSDDSVPNNGEELIDINVVRDPVIAKTKGITNVHRRHWEDKKKKGKGKAKDNEETPSTGKVTAGISGKRKAQTETETSGKRKAQAGTGTGTSINTTISVKQKNQQSQNAPAVFQYPSLVTPNQQFPSFRMPNYQNFSNPPIVPFMGHFGGGSTNFQPQQFPFSFANFDPITPGVSGNFNVMSTPYPLQEKKK